MIRSIRHRGWLWVSVCVFILGWTSGAFAQQFDLSAYIDSDGRPSTGCTVNLPNGDVITGVEQQIVATAQGLPPLVTAVRRLACNGVSFQPASTLVSGYPVGLNTGVAGSDVVEFSVPRYSVVPPASGGIRLYFVGRSTPRDGIDVLLTRDGTAQGAPIFFGFAVSIPGLTHWGLLGLSLALALGGFVVLRRYPGARNTVVILILCSGALTAFAVAIKSADGSIADWAGIAPLASDPPGDGSTPEAGNDIRAAFMQIEQNQLLFRIDVSDLENQPPVAAAQAVTTLEDTAVDITLSATDPEGAAMTFAIVGAPTQGTLGAVTPLSATTASVRYTPNADRNGADSFTFSATDAGGATSAPATVSLTITPVNDAPRFTASNPAAVNEDAGAQTVTVATAIAAGPATASDESTQTLTFLLDNNSNAVLFSAGPTLSSAGVLSFTPAANASGTAVLTYRLSDSGGTANGGVDTSAAQTITVTVNAVNDAPVNSVPAAAQTVLEEGTLVFSTANGNALSTSDVDAGTNPVQLGLATPNGTLTLSALTGLTGTGNGTGTLSYVGTLTDINSALQGLSFTPMANFEGATAVALSVNDQGNTGGPAQSDTDSVVVNVTGVNDAPVFTGGGNQTALEDAGSVSIAGWATGISDSDPATQVLTFQFTSNSNAALFSAGPAVDPSTGNLSFTPAANANGAANLTLVLSDNGGTANGGVNTSAPFNFSITITPVNDAPSFVVGANETVNEDASGQLVVPWATSISAGPADEAGQTLTFNITGNTNAALFNGAPSVNSAGALTYVPAPNANGVATITLTLSDSGSNTPPNVNTSAAQTFTITINAVNDAPINTVPAAQATGDVTPLVFSTANTNALSVADLDAAAGLLQLTLSTGGAGNGTLTLTNPGGVLATLTGNGTDNVVATGTLANLNLALNGPAGSLTYTPVVGTSATRTLTMTTSDQGNTGLGGAQTDTDTVAINVDAAPVVSATPAAGLIANDATFTINFSESVTVTTGISLSCGGGPNLFTGGTTGTGVTTLTPSYTAPLPAGACVLTVPSASVTDTDTIDPPNNPIAAFTRNYTVDAAPAFVSATPAAAAVVAANATVSFTYDEPVNGTATAITLNCGGPITGALSGSGTATLTFTPAANLPFGSSCTATAVATQISDVDSADPPQNPVANTVRNFSVDAEPTVTGGVPANSATNVATNTAVTFTFSENVDAAAGAVTLNCGGNIAGSLTGTGSSTLTFTPSAALPENTPCTATAVAANINDSDALDPPNALPANVSRSFTTDAAPAVTTTTPANSSINAPINGAITVNFSEPVTFSGASFTLECPAGSTRAFSVSGSGTSTATLTPAVNLPVNTVCVVTVLAATIDDVDAGDPPANPAANVSFSFTTVNDNPPAVSTTEVEIGNTFTSLPLGSGLASDSNTQIRLTFSEVVNPTGAWAQLLCTISGSRTVLSGLAVTNIDPVFVLTPSVNLSPGDVCTLTVFAALVVDDDAIDPPDQMTANFVTTFNVDALPTVSSSIPANGATNVALNSALTVNFSENVDVTAGGFGLACSSGPALTLTPSTLSNANTVVLTPSSALPATSSCTLTVTAANVTDSDLADPPNGMAASYTATFTTVDTAPAVTTTVPAAAGTLSASADIIINFNENVTFNAGSFTLECPVSTAIPFAVSGSGTNQATLNPTGNLPVGSTCTVTVLAGGISDVDAVDPPDNLAGPFTFTFTPVNAPPVLTAGASVSYTENAPALIVDGTVTVSDTDSANLASATVQLSTNYVNGEDVLSFTNTPNISGSFAPASGTLTLTGSDTLAAYQAALRTVRYVNTSDNPSTLARTVTWIGNDGIAPSTAVTSTINVSAANDAPVLTAGGTATYTENGAAVILDGGVTAVDADSTNLTGATISITTGFSAAQGDTLSFVNAGGITGNYVAGTGVLTLSGSATVAAYQAALRTITYSNTSENPTASRTISWVATDGTSPSTAVTSTVSITAVNDGPLNSVPVAQAVNEDAARTFNLGNGNLISVADVDVGAGSLQVQLTATNGVLSLGGIGGLSFSVGDGTGDATMTFTGTLTAVNTALSGLVYAPSANYFGAAALTITSNDQGNTGTGGPLSDSDTINITVNPVNDPPVADNDAFDFIGNTDLVVDLAALATPHVLETTGTTFGVLDGDSDPVEGDSIAVSSIVVGGCTDLSAPFDCTDPAVGTVRMQTNGRFTFTPAAGDTGTTETFTYVVSDTGLPGPASATATVTLTRSERVWYVDGDAPLGGSGVASSPFNNFGSLGGAGGAGDVDVVGDTIFVHAGAAIAASTGVPLEANQHVLGQGAGLSFPLSLNGNGSPTVLVAAETPITTRPSISRATGDMFTIGNAIPVEIRALTLSAPGGNAIDLTSTGALTGSSTLEIADNVVSGAGSEGVDINANIGTTGTLNLSIHDNNLTATGNALDIARNAGTVNVTAFDDNVVTGNSNAVGIAVVGTGAAITFDSTPGAPYNSVAGGNTQVGVAGNGVGSSGLVLTNIAGDLTFADLDSFADNGDAINITGTGVVNVGAGTGTRVSIASGAGTWIATGGSALSLNNLTADMQNVTLTSTNSTGSGVSLVGVSDGTTSAIVSGVVASALTNATAADFLIDGGNATVSYAGTITDATGTVLSVANTTADSKTFTGAIGSGAVSLSSNTGATISIRGGLALSTGTATAFSATGGGTIEVCDENPCAPGATGAVVNTLTTTTGTALNVANTTISANNLEFRSISSTGAASGIVVNTTGALGGLKVKGTGSAGTGGTIQASTGTGISLNSTSAANLAFMNVTTSADDGINGASVSGLTLNTVAVTGNGNSTTDEGIELVDPAGALVFNTVTATGNAHNNVFIDDNNNTGGAATLTATNGTFSSNGNANGNHGMLIDLAGNAVWGVSSISGASFSNNKVIGLQVITGDTSQLQDFTVNNNTFSDTGTGNSQEISMDMSKAQTSSMTVKVTNNTITGHNSHGMNFFTAAGAGTTGTYNARITGNVIGNAGTAGSGSLIGNCMRININGDADATVLVDNNTLRQCPNGRGIEAISRNGTGGLDITISNNNVNPNDVSGFPLAAILAQSNTVTIGNTLRANIFGNTVPAGTAIDVGPGFISLVETSTSVCELVGAAANATTQLAGSNTGSVFASGGCAMIPGPISTPP